MRNLSLTPFSTLALLLLSPFVSAQLAQQSLGDLFPGSESSWKDHLNSVEHNLPECRVSRLTAFEQVEGPVPFSESTAEHLEVPKIPTINATAWEQWEFDGTAADGNSGLILGFSRDATYSFFGQGNLRVEFYMILEDGSVVQDLDYVAQSTVIECDDAITGIWNSSDRSYGFRVPRDMSRADVWWQTRSSKGSLSLKSDTIPHLADGTLWPMPAPDSSAKDGKKNKPEKKSPLSTEATVEMAPSLFYNQPIAGANVVVNHAVGKKRLSFSGRGAHGRLWAKDGWFKAVDGFNIIRAFAGPYSISFWRPLSRLDGGKAYYSAQLFHDGEMLVGTGLGRSSSDNSTAEKEEGEDDFALFLNDFSGSLSGTLADRATGRVVEFVSPSRGKRWRFLLDHKRKMFEMGLGGGLGLSGFTLRVTGGEVLLSDAEQRVQEQFQGVGFAEQSQFPEKLKPWQIWAVYGIGFLGQWKNVLTIFFSQLL